MADEKEKSTKKQQIRFYIRACVNGLASKKEGRPVMRDAVYIEVVNSKNEIVNIEAAPEHYIRFHEDFVKFQQSEDYRAFRASEMLDEKITPLSDLNLTPTQRNAIEQAGIRSVEGLLAAAPERLAGVRGVQRVLDRALELATAPEKAA